MEKQKERPQEEISGVNDETTELTRVIETLRAKIAEHKRAENRFRKLLEATPDAMIIVDDQGKIVLANAQAESVFGYPQETLVGRAVEVLIPKDFQEKHKQHRAGYFADPQVRPMGVELELYARHRDGARFPVEISLSPLQTPEGLLVISAIRNISRRKQVQQALIESEERLRVALKSSPLVVSHQDQELRFTWIYNPPPGFSAEGVLGKTDADLLPPEDAKRLTAIKRRVLESGVGAQQEFQVALGGDVYCYDLTVEPLRNVSDEIVGITSAAVDVTERKQAELALQQAYDELAGQVKVQAAELSQAQKDVLAQANPGKSAGKELAHFTNQLRVLADVSQQLSTVLDSDKLLYKVVTLLQQRFDLYYVHIFLLDRVSNMLIMRAGSGEVGRRLRQQHYRIPRDAQQSLVAQAARSRGIISVPDVTKEPRFLPNPLLPQTRSEIVVPLLVGDELLGVVDVQDNQPFRFSQSDVYIFSALAGHVATTLKNAHLFEESRRAQEALRHLATIVETSNDAIIGKDLEGHIVSWNAAAEHLYGYTAAEAVGQPIEIIVPVEQRQELEQNLERIKLGLAIEPFETIRITKDGHLVHVALTISPIHNREGERIGASVIARDIGARRRTEAALRERTQALERSNQELEQFAYVASHDLQEPLRMVSSYMQLLARRYHGQLGADADEFIAFAVDGANRMKDLIQALLAYSRIGTHGQTLQPVDCQAALAQALQNLRLVIEENQASVTYDPLPTVMADKSQLVQLFHNLIGNAIKFRRQQPPQVHVGVACTRGEWLFSVRDNGIGIEPEYAERVFVLFQRLHSREEYPGTGIGLAICKKVVERHGGRIWMESEPRRGSVFYFTLPGDSPPRGQC